MPKRICIFSLAYFPKHVGGAEVALKEITDRISPDNYEFHLVTNRFDATLPREEQLGNVRVHRIGLATREPSMADLRRFPLHLTKLLFQWQAFWKARALHRVHRFDGIWAMMAHSCGVPAGRFKAAFPDVKYVLTLQEGDPPAHIEHKMRFFGAAFDRAFTSADTIQVISTFLGRWAKQRGFLSEPVLVPNAVDTAHFAQAVSDADLAATRATLGKRPGDVFLVTTSRLVKKNAVDDVIRALPMLPPHVHFVVFGTGPDEAMLRALASSLAVADRVHFRGHLDHAAMPQHLKACDIFIRPSRSEGMGNSFVEAMAAGLPVIATQEGGIADFLFDAVRNPTEPTTGFAVNRDDPADIARAVEAILADPAGAATVAATAWALVMRQYDWNHIAKRMQAEVFDPLFR